MIQKFLRQKIMSFLYLLMIIFCSNPTIAYGPDEKGDLDPIIFRFSSNKQKISTGEELELTVTATKRQNIDPRLFFMAWSTDFRIKIVYPEGFIQTGGNYVDYIGEKLTDSKPFVEYKVKGKFLDSAPASGTFLLLRGGENASEIDKFVLRSKLKINVIQGEAIALKNQVLTAARISSTNTISCGNVGGYFDLADCNTLAGWVYDNTQPNTSVTVDLYEGSNLILANIPAANYRADLQNAGMGNGMHGFSIPLPSQLKNGQSHTLSIKPSGCNSELANSPKVINCVSSGCTVPSAPTLSASNLSITSGQLVTLTASNCSGSVTWSTGQTGSTIQVSPTQTTAYSATCTVDGCTSTSSSITITVTPTGSGTCNFTQGQIVAHTSTGSTVEVRYENGCALAYWSAAGSRVNIDWTYNNNLVSNISGTSIDQIRTCLKWENETCTTSCSAPTITKTSGTTVCAATSQTVVLSASGTGTITWYKDGTVVGTGVTLTTSQAGNYTTTSTVGSCTSSSSAILTVSQTSGCGSSSGLTMGLSIWKAGVAGVRTKVKDLAEGDQIDINSFGGSQANWFIEVGNGQVSNSGNANYYDQVEIHLDRPGVTNDGWGPENVAGGDGGPYGLNGRDGGITLSAGTYQIRGKVWNGASQLLTKTINFSITAACNTPVPTIAKTSGTTVCSATNQTVVLSASGSGTINWYRDGTLAGTGATLTTSQAGNYTATSTVGSCTSSSSAILTVSQTSGCGSSSGLTLGLSIWKAGVAGVRTKVKDLAEGDQIDINSFGGSQANWFIEVGNGQVSNSGNANYYDQVEIRLDRPGVTNDGWGPENVAGGDGGPYGLNGRDGGITLSAGTYQIRGKIWNGSNQLLTKTINFSITSTCSTPVPTITKTSGTTVCPATNQTVVLSASGSGTINWYLGGSPAGVGTTITTSQAGNYTATSTVNGCTSQLSTAFSVTQTAGCGSTGIVPLIIVKGIKSLMDIEITGTPGNWLINDKATRTPASGYEWWYFVGSKLIKSSTPLTNEPWKGNHPGRILKFSAKIGLETLNKWSNAGGGYYDANAAQYFEKGDVGAVAEFIFKGATSNYPGLNWNTAIPTNWEPSTQLPQWADISPNMTLPNGFVYAKPPNLSTWTFSKAFSKGVTHWSPTWTGSEGTESSFLNNPTYAKREYNNVPRIRELFNLPATGPYWTNGYLNEQQSRSRGQQISIAPRLWIGETQEGEDYVPETQPMWNWFYEEVKNRYESQKAQDGVPYYLAHNYFTRFGNDLFQISVSMSDNDISSRENALYNTSPSNWPVTHFSPGGSLQHVNTIMHGVYYNVPDYLPQQIYNSLYGMELSTKMGKFSGLFFFGMHEWDPMGPGFSANIYLPTGTLERSDKPPHDPNLQIAMPFLAYEFGNIFVEWGQNPFVRNDITKIFGGQASDRWYPNNQAEPSGTYPSYVFPGTQDYENGYYTTLSFLADLPHFGVQLWNQTAGQVAGGAVSYCTYRIDGGAWITRRSNGSDLLHAYKEGRGFARVRIKDNKACVYYYNPFADNEQHTIDIQNPNNPAMIWTGTVTGNGIHVTNVNL